MLLSCLTDASYELLHTADPLPFANSAAPLEPPPTQQGNDRHGPEERRDAVSVCQMIISQHWSADACTFSIIICLSISAYICPLCFTYLFNMTLLYLMYGINLLKASGQHTYLWAGLPVGKAEGLGIHGDSGNDSPTFLGEGAATYLL